MIPDVAEKKKNAELVLMMAKTCDCGFRETQKAGSPDETEARHPTPGLLR